MSLISIIKWFGHAEIVQNELADKLKNKQYSLFMLHDLKNADDSVADIHLKQETQSVVGRIYSGVMEIGEDDSHIIVYITPAGMVYHISMTCTYLKNAVYKINFSEIEQKRNSSGGKYYCCEKCVNGQKSGDVYITAYGSRYHCDINCTSIKRNYMAVYKDDLKNKRCCSKCGGGI